MLKFILETFKNNPNYDYVVLDGKKVKKSDFDEVDSLNEVVKIGKDTFLNLNTIKELRFGHILNEEETQTYINNYSNLMNQI